MPRHLLGGQFKSMMLVHEFHRPQHSRIQVLLLPHALRQALHCGNDELNRGPGEPHRHLLLAHFDQSGNQTLHQRVRGKTVDARCRAVRQRPEIEMRIPLAEWPASRGAESRVWRNQIHEARLQQRLFSINFHHPSGAHRPVQPPVRIVQPPQLPLLQFDLACGQDVHRHPGQRHRALPLHAMRGAGGHEAEDAVLRLH